MTIIEKIKLVVRAYKYKYRNDKGGIRFLQNKINTGNTILDIGAHKAGYLFWIRKSCGKSGNIVAFEPQKILFKYISSLKKYYNWGNVKIEHLALSDYPGNTELYIPLQRPEQSSSPSATIVESACTAENKKIENIATQTLDNYCEEHGLAPDFLKIDVEGNELNVLKGGIKTIGNYKPDILVEIEARHSGKENAEATFAFLTELGYVGHFINAKKKIPLENFRFDKHQNLNDKKNYCNNFTFEVVV